MEKDIFAPLNYFLLVFGACIVFIVIGFLLPINMMRVWNWVDTWRTKK